MPLSKRRTIVLAAFAAINLAAGVALQFSGVFILGASATTDAYFAAQTLPMVVSSILAGAILNNLTPMLAQLDAPRREALVRAVSVKIAFPGMLILVSISLLANLWSDSTFLGFKPAESQLIANLTPIVCTTFALSVLTSIGISAHHANGKFVFVEASQWIVTVIAVAVAVPVTRKFGIFGFAVVLLCRSFISLVLVGPRISGKKNVQVSDLTRVLWERVIGMLSSSAIFKLGPIVDRSLASFAVTGTLTTFGVGQQFTASIATISDRVLARPLLVAAGLRANSPERREVVELYGRQVKAVGIGALLMFAAGLAVVGLLRWDPSLAARFDLNRFGSIGLLFLIAATAIPAAASQLSSALMYALGDSRTLSRVALISFTASSLIKLVGFLIFGVYAIVAGMFLYQSLNWLLLLAVAKKALQVPFDSAGARGAGMST